MTNEIFNKVDRETLRILRTFKREIDILDLIERDFRVLIES